MIEHDTSAMPDAFGTARSHISVDAGTWTILVSFLERAILEVLDGLPAHESFEYPTR